MNKRPTRASSTAECPTSSSPYRRVLPRDLDMETDPLQVRLDFHRESVVLHDYGDGAAKSRLVSAMDVAHALASELDLDSGLLPVEALWFVKTAGGTRVAVWRAPQLWTLRLRVEYGQRARRFRLPMPGLVFVCPSAGQVPAVFAARQRPRSSDEPLFHCPTFNVFRDGRICPGTHVFPRDPSRIPEDFFKSHFSPTGDSRGRSRQHPEDLLALWTELHDQQEYPLDDLLPALPLSDALRVGS